MTLRTETRIDTEKSFVGSIIRLPVALDEVSLCADAITDESTNQVYGAICSLHAAGRPIDLTTVATELGRTGVNMARTLVVALADDFGIPSRDSILDCAKTLNNYYRIDRLSTLSLTVKNMAKVDSADAGTILTYIENEIAGMSAVDLSQTESVKTLSEQFAVDVLSGAPHEEGLIGSRIADLDAKIGGFAPGEYCVIAAPPSFGKTAFAFDLLNFNATLGHNSLYIALDQSKRSMIQRLFSAITGLDKRRIFGRQFSDDESRRIVMASGEITGTRGTVFINDNASLTMSDIRSLALTYQRRYDIKVLAIDYIQQIRPQGRTENRTSEMTQISGRIKALAKELNIPIIACSQLSRAYDQGDCDPDNNRWPRPRLSFLRDSGAIEQDANLVCFLFNKLRVIEQRFGDDSAIYRQWRARNPEGVVDAELIIAKQKEGSCGIVPCKFNETEMRFYSVSTYPDIPVKADYDGTNSANRPRMAPEGAPI